MAKRDSQNFENLEIDLKTYTSIRYQFQPTPLEKYDVRKPILSELLEWKIKQGKLGFYSRAKTFLGIRVAVSSWTEAYVGISADKLYFYKSVDELDRQTDFVFELDDLIVQDTGESQGKQFTFCVVEKRGARLVLAAYDYPEYLSFVNTIRNGSNQYKLQVIPYYNEKAKKVQNFMRGSICRLRYLRMRKGFIRLASVQKGRDARKQFEKEVQQVILIQSFLRMGIAKNQKELLKLQGNVTKFHQMRTYTFEEIVRTEEGYVKDMELFLNVFLKPMRALLELYVKNNPDIELTLEKKTVETINIVFDNISKIITIHTKFSKLLNDKIANWHETQEVGQIFIDFSQELDIYLPYCTNYEANKKSFEAAKSNKALEDLLDRITPTLKQTKKQDVFGFLILPIQRVPRYSLLLSDFLKRTWKDHPDYHSITEAVSKMQKAANVLNEARRKSEEKKKTDQLLKKFREPTEISELLSKSDNVACIFEGSVLSNHSNPTEDDPKKYSKAYMFLFSDQIIIAKMNVDKKRKEGKKLKLANTIKFSDAFPVPVHTITEDSFAIEKESHPYGFTVQIQGLKLKLFVKTEEARDNWIKEINKVRNYNKNKKK